MHYKDPKDKAHIDDDQIWDISKHLKAAVECIFLRNLV